MAARDVSGLRSPCICGLLLSPPRRACPAADVRDDSVVTGSCRLACCPPEATAPAAGAVRGWGVLSEEPAQATTVLQAGTAEDMGPEVELLWPGSALLLLLLLLLGAVAVAGLCVHCSRPGPKRTEKIYEQRNLQERQQSFSVASRTYSSIRQAWPGPLTDTAPAGKDKLLHFSTLLEGSRRESDAYIDPIAADYYNWSCSWKPLQDEDDTNSYENVLVCQPRSRSAESAGREESGDYQNSASIQQLQESPWAPGPGTGPPLADPRDRQTAGPPRVISPAGCCGVRGQSWGASGNRSNHSHTPAPWPAAQVPGAAHLSPVGSPDEDSGESDYVNGDVAGEA
ncbi:linker for activation of T-cells family member 2 isoform X4 [Heterocephalus glaber]|uniref:Linker for activation of T-cells family member 2 isoform X4 n=1 Tax=Heterocephalus glaber TaxID=10181 RepID=A0AAX6SME5_HETGA|nr:linker for activation of T-cells family member 2 isoform X4 [Heterocephalus glaber]